MLALIIILLILALLLLLRVGIDASASEDGAQVSAKIGFIRIRVFPVKRRDKAQKRKPDKKQKKSENNPEKAKQKLTKSDIRGIIELGLKTLGRLRRKLDIELFMLHVTVASDDPCDTVINYGRINALISAALPLLHRAFDVKKEDIRVGFDFESEKIRAQARLTAGFRVWEILYIALCAGIGFLKWRKQRRAGAASEMKG